MTVTIPASVGAEGNVRVMFASALSSRTSPTIVQLNGATTVDISCHLMPDWGGITGEQATGEDRRYCSRESFDRLGRVKRTIAPMTYTYLPQSSTATAGNEAYLALTTGNTGYLVIAYGINPADTTLSAADKVESIPVECGVQNKNAAAADEFAPLTITQTLGATGVVVAGVCV